MDRWVLFVAARHFRTKRREKGHTAGILSVGGISAGVMTLIAVLAVMNGFQLGTINDILELNSYHLRVHNIGDDAGELLSGTPGVRSAVPFADIHALAHGYFDDPQAVLVRALPEDVRDIDAGFAGSIDVVAGSFDLGRGNGVVGGELARRLGLRVGDVISIVNFGSLSATIVRPEQVGVFVSGIFTTGFLEYDAGWVIVSTTTARAQLGYDGPVTWGVKLRDRYADRQAASRITGEVIRRRGAFSADTPAPAEGSTVVRVDSWRDFNRAIFSALRLEKTLMMLLVGLIFIVVAVNIYQSLRRSVVERTEEIGVLKAIGARPASLQLVFVVEGLWIGMTGATLGTVLGLMISVNINGVFAVAERVVNWLLGAVDWFMMVSRIGGPSAGAGGFAIFSPAYFYLDSVPSVVLVGEVLGIFVFAVASATMAAFGASRRISRIEPARVLRYE